MDQSAIKLLQETAIQASGNLTRDLNNIDGNLIALPQNYELHNLEQHLVTRTRFRGTISTNSLPDFAIYTSEFEQEGTTVFINRDNMAATAVINHGDVHNPGHCDHKAVVALDKTAQFKNLLQQNGRATSQGDMAEWLEDWLAFLTCTDADGNDIPMVKAIAAIRRTTIEAVRKEEHTAEQFSNNRSLMEQIDAKSRDVQPAFFTYACQPYEALRLRNFIMRLSITTGDGKPRFCLRIVQLEVIEEEMANEFKALLTDELPANVAVYLGKFDPR